MGYNLSCKCKLVYDPAPGKIFQLNTVLHVNWLQRMDFDIWGQCKPYSKHIDRLARIPVCLVRKLAHRIRSQRNQICKRTRADGVALHIFYLLRMQSSNFRMDRRIDQSDYMTVIHGNRHRNCRVSWHRWAAVMWYHIVGRVCIQHWLVQCSSLDMSIGDDVTPFYITNSFHMLHVSHKDPHRHFANMLFR